jgi:RNA polymerase sigma-70 factor (ECF subfamily)
LIGRAQEETMLTTGQLGGAVPRGPAADRDASLVERLRRHEEGAAEELVAQYGDRAYRLAMRITNNSSDAEEVVQDALWAASRQIDTFRGTAAFGSWVYRITANAAYQKRRARRYDRNETSWEDLASPLDETGRPVQSVTDWSPLLRDPALQTELQAVLRAAIDELPDEHRATFLLRDVEGLSNPEVAEALQTTTATVKSRVHRARLFLRGRLSIYLDGVAELGTRDVIPGSAA